MISVNLDFWTSSLSVDQSIYPGSYAQENCGRLSAAAATVIYG
jgi:hypothetical protein